MVSRYNLFSVCRGPSLLIVMNKMAFCRCPLRFFCHIQMHLNEFRWFIVHIFTFHALDSLPLICILHLHVLRSFRILCTSSTILVSQKATYWNAWPKLYLSLLLRVIGITCHCLGAILLAKPIVSVEFHFLELRFQTGRFTRVARYGCVAFGKTLIAGLMSFMRLCISGCITVKYRQFRNFRSAVFCIWLNNLKLLFI